MCRSRLPEQHAGHALVSVCLRLAPAPPTDHKHVHHLRMRGMRGALTYPSCRPWPPPCHPWLHGASQVVHRHAGNRKSFACHAPPTRARLSQRARGPEPGVKLVWPVRIGDDEPLPETKQSEAVTSRRSCRAGRLL
eukprot:360081-Chlamydomonas_euryale.AAC.1